VHKTLHALVEINTSQVETILDGLRLKLMRILLDEKEFSIAIQQLFGRLLSKDQEEEQRQK
jgi:hypothetical protein